MNLVHSHGQAFVRSAKQRRLRGLERLGQLDEQCLVPIEMGHNSVFGFSIWQHVPDAVGKSNHVRTDKLGSANIRYVDFQRRTEIHNISNKFHFWPAYAAHPQGNYSLEKFRVYGERLLHSSQCAAQPALNIPRAKVGHIRPLADVTSHVLSHGAAVAASAAQVQITKAISPKISMMPSVCERNIASLLCEANENAHKISVKFNSCRV